MLLSNSITLIVVTRDRLIRADFASPRAAEPKTLIVRERPHIDDPVALVETAIGFDRAKPGRVFVLSSDLWTHTLSLNSANTHGLTPEDLQQMLGFEAEPLSGASAFEVTSASLAIGESAGQKHFWLTQVPLSMRDQVDEAVRKIGGRLGGIAHPGGVPLTFEETAHFGMPGRVEFWPGAAVRVVYADKVITKAHVDDGAVAANWLGATADWKQKSGATHMAAVVPEGSPAAYGADDGVDSRSGESGTPFLSLEDDATLRRWLAAWHQTLRAKSAAVPLVVPPARRMNQRQRNMVSAVAALVLFGACYAHHQWVGTNIKTVAVEKAKLEEPGTELAAVKTQIATVEKNLKKLEEEKTKLAADVRSTESAFDSHRRRLAELMRRLSDDSSHDWVLQEITATGREIKLIGTTMHPEHISTLTSEITHDFGKLGWGVEPAKQEARNVADNGGPWKFEIQLRDLKVPVAVPSATSPAVPATPPSTIVRVPAP